MDNQTNTNRLMSIGEASEYLNVSIDTLRRWEKKGRISPLRSPGGHRYYSKDDLDALFGKRYTRDEQTLRRSDKELGKFQIQEIATSENAAAASVVPTAIFQEENRPSENTYPPQSAGYAETVAAKHVVDEPVSPTIGTSGSIQSILEPSGISSPPIQTASGPEINFSLPNLSAVQNSGADRPLTEEEIERRVNSILKTDTKRNGNNNLILGIFSSLILIADVVLLYIWAMSAKIVSPIP